MKTEKEKEEMYLKHKNLIYLILRKIGVYYKLDELYDVAIIGLVRGINTYDKNKGIKESSYLTICIQNEIFKQLDKDQRQIKAASLNCEISEDGDMLIDFIPDKTIDIQEELNKRAERNMVKVAISKIKPIYQEVIIPYFGINCKSKSLNEIGKDLNMTSRGVANRLKYGLRDLRKVLKDRYDYSKRCRY